MSAKPKPNAADYVIAEYLAAFSQANPQIRPPTIIARGAGWYLVKSHEFGRGSPKRLGQIIKMTDRLSERARAEDTSHGG